MLGRVITRSYVSLAFNQQQKIETIDRSLKSFQPVVNGPTDTISEVGKDTNAENQKETLFEIVSSGPGSALLVKLPPDSEITAATGSTLACSTKVQSKLSLDTTTVKAVGRKLVGDAMFYQKYYTKNFAGDILLAPQRLGEISTIQLKSSAKYMLRRDAFLAKTEKVSLDLGVQQQTGLVNKLVHTVSGPGTLAISHYGGVYRISLAAGEEYQVNPRNLIMWEKNIQPTQQKQRLVPSPRSPLRRYDVIRNIADSPSLQPKLQYADAILKYARNLILGTPEFVKLKGPGDFYLASRVESRFEKSRLMNALAAVNDSTSQLFEQSALFPQVSSEIVEQQTIQRKHPGYAQKSQDGIPSFYAEVGSKGKVSFTAYNKD